MYNLNILCGKADDFSPDFSYLPKKWSGSRKIFTFRYGKNFFKAGELTIEWLLFFLSEPENFLQEFLREFNEKIPDLRADEISAFFAVIFADFDKKTKKSEPTEANIYENFLLSVGMLVKHGGFSYADILTMSVKNFYIFLENIEILVGIKSLADKQNLSDTPEKMREFFRDLPRGEKIT